MISCGLRGVFLSKSTEADAGDPRWPSGLIIRTETAINYILLCAPCMSSAHLL
jgi:hypothetical protein